MGSSSLTRDRTQAPCTGSWESQPLGHQGSAPLVVACRGGCPTHQRTFRSIPGFYPRDVRSTSLTSCDNEEGLLIFPNAPWGLSHSPKPLRGSASLHVQWSRPFLLACMDDLPSDLVQILRVSFLCWREGGDSISRKDLAQVTPGLLVRTLPPASCVTQAQPSTSTGLTSALKWNSVSVLRSHLLFPVAARTSFSSSKRCSFFFYFFPLYTFHILFGSYFELLLLHFDVKIGKVCDNLDSLGLLGLPRRKKV